MTDQVLQRAFERAGVQKSPHVGAVHPAAGTDISAVS